MLALDDVVAGGGGSLWVWLDPLVSEYFCCEFWVGRTTAILES